MIPRCPNFHCNGELFFKLSGTRGPCTRGPLNCVHPAHPSATPRGLLGVFTGISNTVVRPFTRQQEKNEHSKIITPEYSFLRLCTPGHQLPCKFRFISAQSGFLDKWLKYNGFVLFVTDVSCLVFFVDHAPTYMNVVATSLTGQ